MTLQPAAQVLHPRAAKCKTHQTALAGWFDDCSHIKAGTQMAHFSHLTIEPRGAGGGVEGREGGLIVASDNFMPQ